MADPEGKDCPKGEWTKIATNVKTGGVWKFKNASYFQTYRDTGGAAPTTLAEGVPMFQGIDKNYEPISYFPEVDIYVWCKVFAGRVRVDL